MKKKTFAILFYVKRTKLLRNGEAPIFVRITVDALRAEMSIQRSINLSEWIEKKCCAKSTSPKNRELNHYLEHIRHRLYEIQKELEDENKVVTAELLKNRYMGVNEANVPLLPIARQILDKYKNIPLSNGQVLPIPTNQKMNAYLKEIADVCGINKIFTTHVARHTFATTVTLANNVSIESVSKMLGHKSIKMTQHYAKVLEKTVVREMEELAGKLNYVAV